MLQRKEGLVDFDTSIMNNHDVHPLTRGESHGYDPIYNSTNEDGSLQRVANVHKSFRLFYFDFLVVLCFLPSSEKSIATYK